MISKFIEFLIDQLVPFKIVELVFVHQVLPTQIIAITFTNHFFTLSLLIFHITGPDNAKYRKRVNEKCG